MDGAFEEGPWSCSLLDDPLNMKYYQLDVVSTGDIAKPLLCNVVRWRGGLLGQVAGIGTWPWNTKSMVMAASRSRYASKGLRERITLMRVSLL